MSLREGSGARGRRGRGVDRLLPSWFVGNRIGGGSHAGMGLALGRARGKARCNRPLTLTLSAVEHLPPTRQLRCFAKCAQAGCVGYRLFARFRGAVLGESLVARLDNITHFLTHCCPPSASCGHRARQDRINLYLVIFMPARELTPGWRRRHAHSDRSEDRRPGHAYPSTLRPAQLAGRDYIGRAGAGAHERR